MRLAGPAAYEQRTDDRSSIYAYEQQDAAHTPALIYSLKIAVARSP
ncbi:MAG: hypothetical protein ACRDJH_24015 [Thermomicrobiales bacterium]